MPTNDYYWRVNSQYVDSSSSAGATTATITYYTGGTSGGNIYTPAQIIEVPVHPPDYDKFLEWKRKREAVFQTKGRKINLEDD